MRKSYFCISRFVFIFIYIVLTVPVSSYSQIGLQAPQYNLQLLSDSSRVSFPKPVLPLRNWKDYSDQYFHLEQTTNKLDINRYISTDIILGDPFKMDMRSSSYYVPRMVRDELNLIMNRPRDNAFVPILPAAFLAMQLASQYLFVQRKTEITTLDIKNAQEGIPLLQALWKKNPQTISELYEISALQQEYTMSELQRLLDILVDNKLVKRKLIEMSETQYFYALEKKQYDFLVEKGKSENSSESNQSPSPSVDLNPR